MARAHPAMHAAARRGRRIVTLTADPSTTSRATRAPASVDVADARQPRLRNGASSTPEPRPTHAHTGSQRPRPPPAARPRPDAGRDSPPLVDSAARRGAAPAHLPEGENRL